jgi:hypothetical protein
MFFDFSGLTTYGHSRMSFLWEISVIPLSNSVQNVIPREIPPTFNIQKYFISLIAIQVNFSEPQYRKIIHNKNGSSVGVWANYKMLNASGVKCSDDIPTPDSLVAF